MIEQVGSYDPLPNENNEKLVAFNLERIRHWIGNGADISTPVAQLLGSTNFLNVSVFWFTVTFTGLAGFLPIHPTSYIAAWRNRRAAEEEAAKKREQEQIKNTEKET